MSSRAINKMNPIKYALLIMRRQSSLALAAIGLPGLAFAGPTGEQLVGGDANITRPDTRSTVIDQYSHRAAVNWQTFDVNANEYVVFNQPSSSAVILNRVIGGSASSIFGRIDANGQVFLLNPHGMFFAPGASINVHGLVASTLDMNPNDFMSGNYSLVQDPNAPLNGQVVNAGSIQGGDGGYVVLAGDYVENSGVIAAQAGHVALAAGSAVTLDVAGDGLVNFAVDQAALSDYAGVKNAGSVINDGGFVIMTAKVASELVATAVNNEGQVQARSIQEKDGVIFLSADGGDISQSGELNAYGIDNQSGGTIIVRGDEDIDLANGGVISAQGDGSGSGGFVRVIAEKDLTVNEDATIRVAGAPGGGGFVEVSGHGSLSLRGIIDLGSGGSLLIDPSSITIVTGTNSISSPTFTLGSGFITNNLNLNNNVTIVASNMIDASAGVTSINATGTGTLRMAIGAIPAPLPTCNLGVCSSGVPTVVLGTGGTIDLSGVDINVAGTFNATADSGSLQLKSVTTNNSVGLRGSLITVSGDLNFHNFIFVDALANSPAPAGSFNISGNIDANGGNVFLTANNDGIGGGGNLNYQNIVNADVVTLDATAASSNGGRINGGDIDAARRINVNGQHGVTVGNLTTASDEIEVLSSLGGDIVTGSLTLIDPDHEALIRVSATNGSFGGDITINGDITVSGFGGVKDFEGFFDIAPAALVQLETLSNGADTIQVNGNINIRGNGDVQTVSGSSADFPGINQTVSGTFGRGELKVLGGHSNGNIDINGDVDVQGVGGAKVFMSAENIAADNITANATPADTLRVMNTTCAGSCSVTKTITTTGGGLAEVRFDNIGGAPGNVFVTGDINARGPNADVSILGEFDQVQTRNISVSATGADISRTSTGTASYGGVTVDFEENIKG
ncbi:MAG: filamentous hemagglutinin N-terminal domain-containing protein, partial [Gammaproteobacteria bacterium]|nr:filamentous hemagglutinin N-terminal domain-containing protein [Gammaproteobacteria bacterium]